MHKLRQLQNELKSCSEEAAVAKIREMCQEAEPILPGTEEELLARYVDDKL